MSHGLVTDQRISRDQLLTYREQPVAVIGAASAEGVAVLRLLVALGFSRVTVHDQRDRDVLRKAFRTTHGAYSRVEQDAIWTELKPLLADGRFGSEYLAELSYAHLVVLPQGWYLDEENRAGIVAGVGPDAHVTSMVELYFALHRGPIAAITGTNGKSTTVGLAEHLLDIGGVAHRSAGNERSNRQFLPEIDEVPSGTWALLETSNRQLLQLERSPQVAAITALTPDHLQEHDGFAGYRDTKARLFVHQGAQDVAIANADDAAALEIAERSPAAGAGRLVRCGIGPQPAPSVTWLDGVLIAEGVPRAQDAAAPRGHGQAQVQVIATAADLRMPGAHNQRNAAVAVALALACGADPQRLAEGLRTYEGKALRLERLEEIDGVEVWSDLKSTTPEATVAALDALAENARVAAGGRVWLVAGGGDKGLDYAPLAAAMLARGVQAFAVPGSATDALEAALGALDGGARLLERVSGLEAALGRGFECAASGDIVIVSPAAAGFWTRELQGGSSLRSLVRRRAQVPKEALDR